MSERRFPNSDEIAALKAKGVVSISNLSCRLGAGLCLLLFILGTNFNSHFSDFLSANDFFDPIVVESAISLLRSMLFGIALYLVAFIVLAIFQSRFYFQIGAIFRRHTAFLDLKRAFSFFKITALLSVFGILLSLIVSTIIWKELFFSTMGMVESSGFAVFPDILRASSLKLLKLIFGLIFLVIIIAMLYSKVSFRIRHRVADKTRGY